MAIQPYRGESGIPPDLEAEHRTLKEQTAELRREHQRLHLLGGTKEQHRQHIRKLRTKIAELEQHVERLKSLRRVAVGFRNFQG
jgi:hypothetical protein